MAAKRADQDRRARLEEMRRREQAAERRRTLLVAGTAGTVVALLAGVATVVIRDYQQANPDELALVGVTSDAASCSAVISGPAQGAGAHVGPGTDSPGTTRVEYSSAPPTSGEHFAAPESPAQAFYSSADRPPMERLVHNLEHGYTVAWYTADLPAEQVEQLRRISTLARATDTTAGKFVVSAWDETYGTFEEGADVAIAHWGGAGEGHRQYCAAVSGAAVEDFVEAYPATDAPEPDAA